MTRLASEIDVAVIGAGAAGIAAARRLAEAGGVSILVLEGRERAGGRAWTIDANGDPFDLGGEWLHSADRNVLVPLAERLGFSLNRCRPDWTTRLRYSGESAADEADWLREREAHYWAIYHAAQLPEDAPAASVLKPGGRWNALFDGVSTWANAVELESLSVKDNDRYHDTGLNWRVREGYGRLLAALAEGLPIAFGTAVSRVEHDGDRIRLATGSGTVSATRVIVTVPNSAIAGEHLVFDPPLPDKIAAASGLPLRLANKLFLRFDGMLPGVDGEVFLVGSTRRRETMSYQVRPLWRPRIQCFFGANFAAQLEQDGIAAMVAWVGCSAMISGSSSARSPPRHGVATRLPAAPIPMRCPAMPTIAPALPRRSTAGCFSPAKHARPISSRRCMAPTKPAPPPPRPR